MFEGMIEFDPSRQRKLSISLGRVEFACGEELTQGAIFVGLVPGPDDATIESQRMSQAHRSTVLYLAMSASVCSGPIGSPT
jgi:hypothetical protein